MVWWLLKIIDIKCSKFYAIASYIYEINNMQNCCLHLRILYLEVGFLCKITAVHVGALV